MKKQIRFLAAVLCKSFESFHQVESGFQFSAWLKFVTAYCLGYKVKAPFSAKSGLVINQVILWLCHFGFGFLLRLGSRLFGQALEIGSVSFGIVSGKFVRMG